jgi:outer membrane protein OmpA-like peptidoglycan-associated protein
MRKWAPFFLLLFVGYFPLQAQVRLGILGGIHSSKILETNDLPGWDTAVKKYDRSNTGFQLGLIVEVPLGHHGFFFQPAVYYTTKGRTYDRNNDSINALLTDTIYNKQTLQLGYMEVPLNITYKIPITANRRNSLFLSAGPYFGFIFNGHVTSESLTTSSNKYSSETVPVTVGSGPDTYKTVDLGINGQVGVEMGNLMIAGYFSQGLTSFYNAPYPGTFHHQVIGLSLGIWMASSGTPPSKKKRDTDKDGITDDVDDCPLQPGSAAWHGCPTPDTDHDGVDDDHDSCRTIPGVARYHGCPVPDTDHDGVDDEHDSCPTVPGLARYHGCPIPDRDGDGLNDEVDQCPDSPGPASNHGCPLPAPVIKKETTERVNFIAHNILFKSSSDQLFDGSFPALDQLAALLLEHPELNLRIEGYTDNSGNPAKNLVLSRQRAETVKRYLIGKAIPATRLSSEGFGQEHPIADNHTVAGKAANRRVELKLSVGKN